MTVTHLHSTVREEGARNCGSVAGCSFGRSCCPRCSTLFTPLGWFVDHPITPTGRQAVSGPDVKKADKDGCLLTQRRQAATQGQP